MIGFASSIITNSYVYRTHLFETYPYDEEEKKECLEEALKLREDVGGQNKEIVLPTVPLSKKIESLSWVAVGQSLLETYRTISTDLSSSVIIIYSLKTIHKLKKKNSFSYDSFQLNRK